MTSRHKSFAQEFLEFVHSRNKCAWCKHPLESIYRAGLCGHCYRISRSIARLEAEAEAYQRQYGAVHFEIEYELKVARRMAESAQTEGLTYQNLHLGETSGLELEHELSYISRRFVKKDFYYGEANLFDWCFTPVQKTLIFYLISLMTREYLRRNRRQMSQYFLDE